jgi:hypothetical protein
MGFLQRSSRKRDRVALVTGMQLARALRTDDAIDRRPRGDDVRQRADDV